MKNRNSIIKITIIRYYTSNTQVAEPGIIGTIFREPGANQRQESGSFLEETTVLYFDNVKLIRNKY